jgi:flagellar FliJ protein
MSSTPESPALTRFTFKLESLRALREQNEQQAKEELARELGRKAEREAELSAAEDRLRAARVAGQLAEGSTVIAHDLVSSQAFRERRERERLAAQAGVSAQEAEVGASRERLERAARDRALLERLKQRRADEHRREAAKAEEATLSEIAITSHRRATEDASA